MQKLNKLISIILLFFVSVVAAQQDKGNIKGIIINADTGKPMNGVIIKILNSDLTRTSDAQGSFEFTLVPAGDQIVLIDQSGFEKQQMPVVVVPNKVTDLGSIILVPAIDDLEEQGVISLDDENLSDDNSGSENISGLLQASSDIFERTVSYQFSSARFKLRGLDSKYGTVLMNGIEMNKAYDNRPQWSEWGGLNDMLRNRETYKGMSASDYNYGGLLGTTNFVLRASQIRATKKISYAATNRSYRNRVMASYATGQMQNGWSLAVSASRRWAQEGHFEGTFYDANSVFLAVEKKLNDKHSLNLTAFVTPNRRGKSAPQTQEVFDLKGTKYNSYWGYQDGEKRNARIKNIFEPTAILSHYWTIDDKSNLQTNVAFQKGYTANSRLQYFNAPNPDPTYYRYLPSYWESKNNPVEAYYAKENFLANGQIDWNSLYAINKNYNGPARYFWYDDRIDDQVINFSSIYDRVLKDNIILNAGISYKNFVNEGYAKMNDLMGSEYALNIDQYTGKAYNLLNNNTQVHEGDKFYYDFNLLGDDLKSFAQLQVSGKKIDFFVTGNYGMTNYQREGLFKNELFENNSLGKSEKVSFNNYGLKIGGTFKFTGKHLIDMHFAMTSQAPEWKNVFYNARVNNEITPNIENEDMIGMDASYIYRSSLVKARFSAYYYYVSNATEISRFYAQDVNLGNTVDSYFVTQILTNEAKAHRGVEFGLEAQISPTVKASFAATYGTHTYRNNPDLYLASDVFDAQYQGESLLKDYKVANGPQDAYSLGLEYRDPHYWFISTNINYYNHNYVSVSPLIRTEQFYTNPVLNEAYPGVTDETLAKVWKQEQLEDFFHLNVVGGKSWKIKKYYIGIFGVLTNALDTQARTGGFEQSRKASFPEYYQDKVVNDTPVFGNKYWYGYGRTYYVQLSLRF